MRALLVIDVQEVYISGLMKVTHPDGSLANILRAMDAATVKGVPVIVIQHFSAAQESPFARTSPFSQLAADVASRPRAALIEKALPGSFTGTELEATLKSMGIERVTIAGYMTQMCCDTTAREAMHRGLKVEFLSDATGTLAFENAAGTVSAEELHRAVLVTQASGFSEVLTTDAWIATL